MASNHLKFVLKEQATPTPVVVSLETTEDGEVGLFFDHPKLAGALVAYFDDCGTLFISKNRLKRFGLGIGYF